MPSLQRVRRAEGIELLRLDRPQRRNAMDTALLAELERALGELSADDALRALVISTTSTEALCSGADVGEELDREGALARTEAFSRVYAAIEAVPVPTIAVCVGHCVGGGAELVAGCDLRVGGDNLRLAWAGARMGVPVGPARLVPLVGLARAKELIFTARVVDAREADALGLLHALVPAVEAEATALDLAVRVAGHPPDGIRRLKSLFRALEGTERRVAQESDVIEAFQRDGPGLPYGRRPRGD